MEIAAAVFFPVELTKQVSAIRYAKIDILNGVVVIMTVPTGIASLMT